MELRIRLESEHGKLRLTATGGNSDVAKRVRAPMPFTAIEWSICARALDLGPGNRIKRTFSPEEAAILRRWRVLPDEPSSDDSLLLDGDGLHRDTLRRYVRSRLNKTLIEPLRDIFASAFAELRQRDARATFSVRLEIGADEVALFRYPWELLCGNQEVAGGIQINRYIHFFSPLSTLAPAQKYRLLVLHSEPEGLPPLGLKDLECIRAGLDESPYGNLFSVERIDRPDPLALGHALTRNRTTPTILHFAGHGDFGRRCVSPDCGHLGITSDSTCAHCGRPFAQDSQPRSYLAFHRSAGPGAQWIDSEELSESLALADVRLVVLSACKSALGPGSEDVFNGVAEYLIGGVPGVPAVVATPYPLDSAGAEEFARCFYEEIGWARPLIEAMHRMRRRMRAPFRDEWYRPVLYLRARQEDGGRLLDVSPTPVSDTPAQGSAQRALVPKTAAPRSAPKHPDPAQGLPRHGDDPLAPIADAPAPDTDEFEQGDDQGSAAATLKPNLEGYSESLAKAPPAAKRRLLKGRYELHERLGSGGIATVWRATDWHANRLVTVRILNTAYARNPAQVKRFVSGAAKMAQLRHPGVVRVFEPYGWDRGHRFVVTEYLAGGNFHHAVLDNHLNIAERLAVIRSVGRTLQYAHSCRIAHHRIKPANIVMDSQGAPRLTDFDMGHPDVRPDGTHALITDTHGDAPPKPWRPFQEADRLIDVWGLGLTTVFALTGADPKQSELYGEPYALIDSLAAGTAIKEVLRKALSTNAVERWPSVHDYCNALDHAFRKIESTAGPKIGRKTGRQPDTYGHFDDWNNRAHPEIPPHEPGRAATGMGNFGLPAGLHARAFQFALESFRRGKHDFQPVMIAFANMCVSDPREAVRALKELNRLTVQGQFPMQFLDRLAFLFPGALPDATPAIDDEERDRINAMGAGKNRCPPDSSDALDNVVTTCINTEITAPPSCADISLLNFLGNLGETVMRPPRPLVLPVSLPTTDREKPTANPEPAGATTPNRPRSDGEPVEGDILRNRFRLEKELGRGGMGVVFKAWDMRREAVNFFNPEQNYVAIKLLNDKFRSNRDSIKVLGREFSNTKKLSHPNIISLNDFDKDDKGRWFISMELLSGRPLSEVIDGLRGTDGLPFREAFYLIEQMGGALAAAHTYNPPIIHCDFKPNNVSVSDNHRVKVFDFGIARAARPDQGEGALETTNYDAGRLGALTPIYASLEMLLGQEPDPRDDIYALAIVSYELLTGKRPFGSRTNALQAREQHLTPGRIKSLTARQWRGLRRGLAFERNKRSQNVEQFLDDLRPRRSLLVPTIAAALIGAVILGWFFAIDPWRMQQQEEQLLGDVEKVETGALNDLLAAAAALPELAQQHINAKVIKRLAVITSGDDAPAREAALAAISKLPEMTQAAAFDQISETLATRLKSDTPTKVLDRMALVARLPAPQRADLLKSAGLPIRSTLIAESRTVFTPGAGRYDYARAQDLLAQADSLFPDSKVIFDELGQLSDRYKTLLSNFDQRITRLLEQNALLPDAGRDSIPAVLAILTQLDPARFPHAYEYLADIYLNASKSAESSDIIKARAYLDVGIALFPESTKLALQREHLDMLDRP